MDGIILEFSALLLSLFCLAYSVTVRRRLYFPLPRGVLAALKNPHSDFLILLCVLIFSASASVAGTLGHSGGAGAFTLNLLHMAYYVTHNALSFFFALYIRNLFYPQKEQSGLFYALFCLPLLAGEALILSNPLTRLCFYVDESLAYHRGPCLSALYAIASVYTLAGIFYFTRSRGRVSGPDRTAMLILISVAVAGVVIQAAWSVPVELFFDAIAFLGFLSLLERGPDNSADMGTGFRASVTTAVILTFLAVIFMNVALILDQTAAQSDKIGNIQLDVIRGDLQDTLTEAETDVLRTAIGAEQFLDTRPSLQEVERYFRARRESFLANENFMNVYIAGSNWHVIPGFDAPPDYHAAERIWYAGAAENPGEIYITEPYKDADTGTMCFTVSTMLSDGETVVAMDLNFSKAQETIQRMTNGRDQAAMIVTSGGLIAGYTDMALVGERAEERLPDYTEVIRRVTSSQEHNSFRVRVGGRPCIVFSSETSNGWFLILSVDTATLYAGSYRQMIMMASVNLLMLVSVLVFYLTGLRDRRRAAAAMREEDRLLAALSERLRKAAAKVVRLSDWKLLEESETPEEIIGQIKECGLQLGGMTENLRACSDLLRQPPEPERPAAGPAIGAPSRKVRNGILITLLFSLAVVLALCVRSTVNLGSARMNREMDSYESQLNEWITQQQSILYMFADMIAAQPELFDDYGGAVRWLDDMARNYPEISACYLANPYAEHILVMNNGWIPGDDFKLETRPWYRNTERSPGGFSISAPYLDAQTGLYCITLSRVVYGEKDEFLGIFGIDFYLDKLIHVLGESYSSTGYAFLVDSDHIIINHPSEKYQMSRDVAVSVEDTEYAEACNREGAAFLRDYTGRPMACLSRRTSSGFTILVANRWWNVYGGVVLAALALLALFGFCIVVTALLINRLIHWQETVNRQLVEAADAAVSAGKAKSMFLAQMSHEIRTPINAVLGMNEMILSESGDPEILEYAASIQSAGRTLLSLINSILDFSKIEDGKMELVQARYETLDLLDDLVNMVSKGAAKKGLDLSLDIDPAVPRTLYGDDMRLRQVVTNLLTNAVKYTSSGSITLRLRLVRQEADACELEICVADTGIGIREEEMDRLFDSFQRLDQERNRGIEGTGLGLSIVQRLLRMMDSKLEVQSVYGHGSAFTFRLVQKVIRQEPIGPYESHRRGIRQDPRRIVLAPEADILVVDDNEMNLKVAKGLLKRSRIVPDLADSGDRCLEMAARKEYDMVFLDHMMPGLDGIQTLQALRAQGVPERTAVIALTANAVAGAREEYLRAGFRDYLSKPIEVDDLERILARYLPEDKVRWQEEALRAARAMPEARTEEQAGGFRDGQPEARTGVSRDAQPEARTGVSRDAQPEAWAGVSRDAQAEARTGVLSETEAVLEALSAEGFRAEAGVRYAAGDPDFYLELLDTFAAEQEARAAALRDDVSRRDWHEYEIHVHALKSAARLTGADTLSALAQAQEAAAKAGDAAAVERGFAPLLDRYREAAEAVRRALASWSAERGGVPGAGLGGAAQSSAEQDGAEQDGAEPDGGQNSAGQARSAAGEEISPEELRPVLDEALTCLDSFEVERAADLLKELGNRLFRGQSIRSLLAEADAALDTYEAGAAADKLRALRDTL